VRRVQASLWTTCLAGCRIDRFFYALAGTECSCIVWSSIDGHVFCKTLSVGLPSGPKTDALVLLSTTLQNMLNTPCLKKVCHFHFCDNFGKRGPIVITFSLLNSERICGEEDGIKTTTSPQICSHTTL